jgi:hypothetical protein
MIQSGFLSEEVRKALTALARDGSSPCRVTRRANALVLLDEGWSCQQVAHALLGSGANNGSGAYSRQISPAMEALMIFSKAAISTGRSSSSACAGISGSSSVSGISWK